MALSRVVTGSVRWMVVLAILFAGLWLSGSKSREQREREVYYGKKFGGPVPVDWEFPIGLGLLMVGLIGAGRLTLFQLGLRLQVRPRVFVNYRRDDSAMHALNIAQYLEGQFGRRNVFLDTDRLEVGEDFHEVLAQRLDASDVMIVVVGPQWIALQDSNNRRRIDNPKDWVRMEIVGALERNVVTMPVLVGGASLPKEADLPETLKPVIRQHALDLTTNGFRYEMAGLAREIRSRRKKRGLWVKTGHLYRRPVANSQA